jgi:hypothetical protein
MPTIWRQAQLLTAADVAEIATDPRAKAATVVQLNSLIATKGDPIIGIFIFGSGSTPDFILERSSFPTETGGQQADKLQNDIDAQLATAFGATADTRQFFANTHFFTYRSDKAYVASDYKFYLSNITPPANWWQE